MSFKIALVVNSVISTQSMGGGDRILIELAKSWQNLGAQITLFGPPEAKSLCQSGGLNTAFVGTSNFKSKNPGTTRTYLSRILKAIFNKTKFATFDLIYSASESLPDVSLSARIKSQNPYAIWVIGFYLKAPNPFLGEVRPTFANLLQFLQQKISLAISKYFKTTGLFVLGPDDEKYLSGWGFNHILRIGGGVDLRLVNSVPDQEKIYDACFVGRISQQKGVDDLLKIWRGVINQKPGARLAFIGWGHPGQKEKFIQEVKSYHLEKNIEFLGFQDGTEKYEVMKSSKLLLFPSKYESFGIVVLEALAAGVPVVAYDLPVLRENFQEMVIFVPCGQIGIFTQRVLELLSRGSSVSMLEKGRILARKFDWSKLGSDTFNYINRLSSKS